MAEHVNGDGKSGNSESIASLVIPTLTISSEPNIPGYVEFKDEDSVQKVIALVGQGMTGF